MMKNESTICENCGAGNPIGSAFCKKCGNPLGKAGKESTESLDSGGEVSGGSSENTDKISGSGKNRSIIGVVIAAAAAAVIAIAIIAAIIHGKNNASKASGNGGTEINQDEAIEINMEKYKLIKTDGEDGFGTATASIDWELIKKDYGDKLTYTEEARTAYGDTLDQKKPIEVIEHGVSLDISKSVNLSNDEEISYTWNVDKGISELVNCRITASNGTYKVSGLKEIETFDAFKDLDVQFSGTAPFVYVFVDYKGSELSEDDFSWDYPDRLENGDTLKVELNGDKEKYYSSLGKVPDKYEKEYEIEGFDSLICDYEQLSDEDLNIFRNKAYNKVLEYISGTDHTEPVFLGDFIIATQDRGWFAYNEANENFQNQLNFVFCAHIDNSYHIFVVENTNVYIDALGKTDVRGSSYCMGFQDESWDEVYDFLYASYEGDVYTFDMRVDPAGVPFTPDESFEESEDNENDSNDNSKSDYIFPHSDTELIEIDDLDKLSAEECRIAKNEIYARHGRKFKDEDLQSYFDSCSWYNGTIEPDDFDKDELNTVEKANRDLISEYEKQKGYR